MNSRLRTFLHTTAAAAATAVAASLTATPALAAADVLIDDFTTGTYASPAMKSGWFVAAPEQSGTMIGGYRDTSIAICNKLVTGDCNARNPYNLASSYAIGKSHSASYPSALTATAGYLVGPRIDVDYGYGPSGMMVDLSGASTRRIRFWFNGLSQPLNFNVLLYTGAGRGQDGCNQTEMNTPFVLELPLSEFSLANGGFNAQAIDHIQVILGSGSSIGSVDFGLQRIDVSDTSAPGAIHCGPIGS